MSRLALLRAACLPFESLRGLSDDGLASATRECLAAEALRQERATALAAPLTSAAGPPWSDEDAARARFALLRVRRTVHALERPRASDLEAAASLLDRPLRTALHEYETALDRLARSHERFEQHHARASAETRRALGALAARPLVEHGMWLASRSLVPKVRRLDFDDPAIPRHADRHTAAKAAAYVTRFATKTSPNGVFCAVAPAWVGGEDASVRGTGGIARTDVLLSLAEVRKITACLAVDPALAGSIVPRPNPTLRESAGEWTWWKAATPRNETDTEVHARAKDQPVLRACIEEAARGVHTTPALATAVAARTGLAPAELTGFLAKLVDAGILIAEVEVPWSSRRRLRDLAADAERRGARAAWIGELEWIEEEVDRVARLPFPSRAAAMDRIAQRVEALPRRRPYRADELFRVDSASALDVRLPGGVIDDLEGAMARYTPLLARLYPQQVQHRRLIGRYLACQPPDVDVPFLDVYGSLAEPPVAGDAPPVMEFQAPAAEASPTARQIFDAIVAEAAEAGPGEDIEIPPAGEEPPWMAGVLFQVVAKSAEDVAAGRYDLVLNGVFNGVGLALARFAHLLRGPGGEDPVVAELDRAWSTRARPDAVFAELTFNHEARTANAGLRPVLFEREIELPGDLATPGVEPLSLADLVIRYDTAADRLRLRDRRSGIEVVPVLTSGVSPAGIVSSLIHIGRQGLQPVGWMPGFHAAGISHWPRIRSGRVVLFRERWTFDCGQFPDAEAPSAAAYHLAMARWRAAYGLPRHVFVHTTTETKPFYVDLESPPLVDLLRRATASLEEGERLVVTEMYPGPGEMWVRDGSGSYATEFLVQMEGGPVGDAVRGARRIPEAASRPGG